LVVRLGPLAVEQVILLLYLVGNQLPVRSGQQLLPDVHLLVHTAHAVEIGGIIPAVEGGHGLLHQSGDVAFDDFAVGVLGIHVKGDVIAVPDGGKVGDTAAAVIQVLLKGLQVIGGGFRVHHGVEHIVHDGGGVDRVRLPLPALLLVAHPT